MRFQVIRIGVIQSDVNGDVADLLERELRARFEEFSNAMDAEDRIPDLTVVSVAYWLVVPVTQKPLSWIDPLRNLLDS